MVVILFLRDLFSIIAFAHIFVICMGKTRDGWPGYEYHPKIHGWLKLHEEPADWLNARIQCHMEGAFLTSPWSEDFTSAVLQKVSDSSVTILYSGLHTTYAEGAFTYVNEKPAISLNPGDLAELERCGIFVSEGAPVTTDDIPCDRKLPYVCYTPSTELVAEPETEAETDPKESEIKINSQKPDCGYIYLGYEFSEQTGHCYKFHEHAVYTWDDAKRACEEEGAHLAIVNSDKEAQVLVKLFKKYPSNMIRGAEFTDTAAIGIFHSESSENWETIEGETLEQAGYEKWRPNAPHPGALFGFICRDGLLYGYAKQIRNVPFICERNPSVQESTSTTERESKQEPIQEHSLGYVAYDQTSHAYKLHEEAVNTMDEANTVCEAEGAQLAVAYNGYQYLLLKEIFEKYPPKKTISTPVPEPTTAESFFDYYYEIKLETSELDLEDSERELRIFTYKDDLQYAYTSRSIGGVRRFICHKLFSKAQSESVTTTEPVSEIKTEAEPKSETEPESDAVTEPKIEKILKTEKEINLKPDAAIFGEKNLGYKFSEQTGSWYKFHEHAVYTWNDAKRACEEERAHLAIVNSDKEAQVLVKLFKKYPSNMISGAEFTDTAAIGIFRSEFSENWETIEGETLEQAGYEKWRPNAPHPGALFGFICRDGLLYGYAKQIRNVPFICERNPSVQESTPETERESEEPIQENSLGYETIDQSGFIYKFHEEAVNTMDEANTVCEAEGAKLTVVKYGPMSLLLMELYEKHPPKQIITTPVAETTTVNFNDYNYDEMNSEDVETNLEKFKRLMWGFTYKDHLHYAYAPHSIGGVRRFICEKKKPNAHSESVTTTEPVSKTDLKSKSSTDPETETETDQESETTTELESESETTVKTETEIEPEPESALLLTQASVCGEQNLGYDILGNGVSGKCFKYHEGEVTLDEAQAICEAEGAQLSIYNNLDYIMKVLKLYIKNHPASLNINGERKDSTWPIRDSLMWGFDEQGKLRYILEGFLSPFICKKNKTIPKPEIDIGTTPAPELEFVLDPESITDPEAAQALILATETNRNSHGYETIDQSGLIYKFHEEAVNTMDEANTVCEAEGAKLAVAKYGSKSLFLLELYEKHPPKQIITAPISDTTTVNFFDESVTTTEPVFEIDSKTEPESKTSTELETETETDQESETTTELESESETTVKTETETQPEPESAFLLTQTPGCGEKNIGYETIDQSGLIYKFHEDAVNTMDEANTVCEAEGAKLAVTKYGSKSILLLELYEKYSPKQIITAPVAETTNVNYYDYINDDMNSEDFKSNLEESDLEFWSFTYKDNLLYAYATHSTGGVRRFICEKKNCKAQSESITTTEPVSEVGTETDPESKSSTEPETAIETDPESDQFVPVVVTTEFESESGTTVETEAEIEPEPESALLLTQAPGCGENNHGYETLAYDVTGKCYKYHKEAVNTMDEAKKICEAEGAELAVAFNGYKYLLLMGLYEKHRPKEIISTHNNDALNLETSESNTEEFGQEFRGFTTDIQQNAFYAYAPQSIKGVRRFICEKNYKALSESVSVETESELESETVTKPKIETRTDPESETTTELESESETTAKTEIVSEPESALKLLTLARGCGEKNLGYETLDDDLTGKCYKYHEEFVTFDEARAVCEQESAQLATYNNLDNIHIILKIYIRSHPASLDTNDESKDSTWPIRDSLIWGFDEEGKLRSINHGDLRPFICKKDTEPEPETGTKIKPEFVLPLTLTPKCNRNSHGYEFSRQTRQCYKFHAKVVKTWSDAKATCEEEGAHLAIINSDVEAQVIIKLFEKYPPEEIHGALYPNTAAVGYINNGLRLGWETIEGQTPEDAGYAAWRPGAPHPLALYGFICRDGLLYGYIPTIRDMPFICEKKPF